MPSLPTSAGGVRIERVVTSGQFCLDGGCWDVDNNVWIIGDDHECIVVDAAHDAEAILGGIAGRRVVALICTHAHNDHVNAVAPLLAATGATAYLHPADHELWAQSQPGDPVPSELGDGARFTVGDVELEVLHTPGHCRGACCLYAAGLGVVLSGDTLFNGGPGATGRSFSDYPTIVESIRNRLLTLPSDTVVLTGHGDSTTIGAEAARDPFV